MLEWLNTGGLRKDKGWFPHKILFRSTGEECMLSSEKSCTLATVGTWQLTDFTVGNEFWQSTKWSVVDRTTVWSWAGCAPYDCAGKTFTQTKTRQAPVELCTAASRSVLKNNMSSKRTGSFLCFVHCCIPGTKNRAWCLR